MVATTAQKEKIKRELAARLSPEKEIRKVVVFGSFLMSATPNDLDVAIFQDSDEAYLPLAMKYGRLLRPFADQIPIDVIPVRPTGAGGEFLAEIEKGEVVYERWDPPCRRAFREVQLMADLELAQAEADALIAMEKHRANEDRHDFPMAGDSLIVPLLSSDKREQFLLDISRGQIDLLRGKYQNRARQVVVLVRLDFGGRPHRNPDDQELPCPHLHLYREGYGDKWAIPVPVDRFSRISDLYGTLEDFMWFCNITLPPYIDRGLFA